MWTVLRLVALLVIAAVAALVVGAGDRVLALTEVVLAPFGVVASPAAGGAVLSSTTTTVAVVAGLAAALVRPADRVVGQLVTVLHELGHTVAAAALGGRPSGIVLRHDASGHATARWTSPASFRSRTALAVVALVGVPAAAIASAAGAQLLLLAGPAPVLWSLAATGAVVTLLARNAWALLVALALAAAAVAALGDAVELWGAGLTVAVLTAVGVKVAVDGVRATRVRIPAGDDARVVARHVHLPARLVQLLQVAATAVLAGWTLWLLTAGLRAGS